MIDRIIDFSVRNKLAVFAVVSLAAIAGYWSMQRVPLDAIPDLSDTQVIIYSRWNQSPDIVEDQVTYPIVSAMLGAPGVRAVRGISDFGYSFVYVIFEDGTDLYWARSRTLEYLSPVLQQLPDGVRTELGPDAIGLGWIYQYARRGIQLSFPDALIGATALAHGLALVTTNARHFPMEGLQVLPVDAHS